jgi:hypothetical protein
VLGLSVDELIEQCDVTREQETLDTQPSVWLNNDAAPA